MGKFSLDISSFVKKAKANPRAVVKKVVLDLGESQVMMTPVGDPSQWSPASLPAPAGYVGGRARGGWQYSKNQPNTREPGTIDESGAVAMARITAGVITGDAAVQHYVVNNTPYIRRLEYEGWSKQAPEGMTRISVLRFQRYMERAVKALP